MLIRQMGMGDLHRHIQGKTIGYVAKTDQVLVIHCQDGTEVRVAWVNGNGEPVKGEPAIAFGGLNVLAKTASLMGRGQGT